MYEDVDYINKGDEEVLAALVGIVDCELNEEVKTARRELISKLTGGKTSTQSSS